MDYMKLQNGSDIRGVALEGIEGQRINLTEQACRDIGRGFAVWLKNKTGKNTEPANTNQVWGQGETPLKEVLNLLKDQKWPIYCDIELEYEIKPWSNAVKELGVCVRHARELLM